MGQHKRNKGQSRLTVAVCIPSIPGRETDLMRAELSVMEQTRQPDQLLVELDTERTGAAATRNRLLDRVETDVIAWLDDDDFFEKEHLRICMRVMEQSPFRPVLVYPAPHMVNGRDPTAVSYQGKFPVSPWGLRFDSEMASHIKYAGSFIPMTHLVRTAAVRAAGGFPEGRTLPDGRYQGEDERYLIGLLDKGYGFEHINRRTWFWNVNPRSTAGKGSGQNMD